MEKKLFQTLKDEQDFMQKASYLSRLGSGSACRSVYGGMAIWGASNAVSSASDLFAIPFENQIHEVFKTFHDDILIISKGEKSVSSRAGHNLMEGNIYAQNRYDQANQRFRTLLQALKTGDIETFGKISESEALTLHALMMTSNPPYILIKPNTLAAIEKIQAFRAETGESLYFSLDAGPNLHLLYPENAKTTIQSFIKQELSPYCEGGQYIQDMVGKGPLEL